MIIYSFLSHPDDCELWAGGTLLKHVINGDTVKAFMFYDISRQRQKESTAALKFLGILPVYYPTKTTYKPDVDSFLKNVESEVPDVIITHWNFDSHIEHRAIFKFSTLILHHWNRNKIKNPHGTYPVLLMCSTYFLLGENQIFQPDIIIDITDVLKDKIKAIKYHKSQKTDLLIKDIKAQNSLFGSRIEKLYAEGFLEYPLFGKNRSLKRKNLNDIIDF